MKKIVLIVILNLIALAGAETQRKVYVYNWSDYINEDTLKNFEKETGIKVIYDVFDSNEVLEAKLFAGGSGYDIVVPSNQFLSKQIMAGSFQKLDKSKLPNYKHLDESLLKVVEPTDPENAYSFPYLWGTTGLGYNKQKIKERLGIDEVKSWDVFFKKENLAKLKDCGVVALDAPQEVVAAALHYLGKNPNLEDKEQIIEAEDLLSQLRPYITYFHSSKYITDLANGDVCLALGWSGDIMQARDRAIEAQSGVQIEYVVPEEGAAAFFDVMAIPAGAKNIEEAHQFLNFLMKPENIAPITNKITYASINKDATELVDADIRNNPNIYLPEELNAKMYVFKPYLPKLNRALMRSWNNIKAGKLRKK